jgi:hypothetical protein
VVQTSDGGYAIAGWTASFGAGSNNVYLVKVDSAGNMLWNKTYGGTNNAGGNSVVQTSDGGYAIAGVINNSLGAGGYDVYLVKTDSAGIMVWNKTYGGTNNDEGDSVVQTSDGGFAIAGVTNSFGAGDDDVYLVKTDSAGNMLWNKTYGGTKADRVWQSSSLARTGDGGYAIAGYTYSFGVGSCDVYLIKTDSAGIMQWNKTFGGTTSDFGASVVQTSDGGYAIAGDSLISASSRDVYLVKTDAVGIMQWNKTYGGMNSDAGKSMFQTNDSGYIITGMTNSFGAGGYDVYLVKTDSAGIMVWNKTYGGTNNDIGFSVVQTSDGGYAIAGVINNFDAGEGTDVYLIKTNSTGIIQ